MQHCKHLSRQNMRPFSERLLLKYNENTVFFFKITQNKEKIPLEDCTFCHVKFGGCPYLLNKTLNKIYINQLRSCNPTNRRENIALFSTFSLQKPWFSSLSRTRP